MSWTDRQKQWYQDNLERERQKRREYSTKFRREYPERKLLRAAKDRAKISGVDCTITLDDIIIPARCPILGKPLEAKTRYAPSLDRIDPALGYIPGNVWVVSRKANVMKNDATLEELEEFARWVNKLKN